MTNEAKENPRGAGSEPPIAEAVDFPEPKGEVSKQVFCLSGSACSQAERPNRAANNSLIDPRVK